MDRLTELTPLPIVLRPGRTKLLLLLAVCLAFFAGGFMMVRHGEEMGYVCSALFGLGGLVFAVNLHPSAAYLRLEETGFTYCNLFRAHIVPWRDVQNFGVWKNRGNRMLTWNFVASYSGGGRARSLSRAVSGFDAGLPDTYGLKTTELADAMETLRNRYS
jgi:hypothetical protein